MNWFMLLFSAVGLAGSLAETHSTTTTSTAAPKLGITPDLFTDKHLLCENRCELPSNIKGYEVEVDTACCTIEEPSYLELDQLRQHLGKEQGMDNDMKLQNLLLTKSSIYEFLFDTNYDNMQIDTVYNSDFVVGYFRRGSNINGEHNNNGKYVKNLYLSYCELSPEMLSLTLTNMPSLSAVHLDHVRLIPYPPPDDIPSDVLNIVIEKFRGRRTEQKGVSISLVDCRLTTLKVRAFNSSVTGKKWVSLDGIKDLRMLSLARNSLVNGIDNPELFSEEHKDFWFLDLSYNGIKTLNQSQIESWKIPHTTTHLNLQGNPIYIFDFKDNNDFVLRFEELWIDAKKDAQGSIEVIALGRNFNWTADKLSCTTTAQPTKPTTSVPPLTENK